MSGISTVFVPVGAAGGYLVVTDAAVAGPAPRTGGGAGAGRVVGWVMSSGSSDAKS
jgi:hypothetical protein